jgi:tRNA C32,U32 (ribose-2'-O)-methylase TrmJ
MIEQLTIPIATVCTLLVMSIPVFRWLFRLEKTTEEHSKQIESNNKETKETIHKLREEGAEIVSKIYELRKEDNRNVGFKLDRIDKETQIISRSISELSGFLEGMGIKNGKATKRKHD